MNRRAPPPFAVSLLLPQILRSLCVLRGASVIHCDIKPENILLKSLDSGEVKLVDYGSACFEGRTVYSYIQSRFYRSPEVVLGHPYNGAIDIWSLGCVAAELFLGLPIFPGASEYNLLQRIVEALGVPPASVLLKARGAGNGPVSLRPAAERMKAPLSFVSTLRRVCFPRSPFSPSRPTRTSTSGGTPRRAPPPPPASPSSPRRSTRRSTGKNPPPGSATSSTPRSRTSSLPWRTAAG